ncbi:MAG: PDZ domain-containing protein [Vicinamibacterales bacterium]
MQTSQSTCGTWRVQEILSSVPLTSAMAGGGLFDIDGGLLAVILPCGNRLTAVATGSIDRVLAEGNTLEQQVLARYGVVLRPLPDAAGPVLAANSGVLVREVWPGYRAEAAGLAPGDVIVELAGSPVTTMETVSKLGDEPGDEGLALTVQRGAKRVSLTLRQRGAKADAPSKGGDAPGVVLATPEDGFAIEAVAPGSRAAAAGLEAGDRLLRIDRAEPASQAEVRRALGEIPRPPRSRWPARAAASRSSCPRPAVERAVRPGSSCCWRSCRNLVKVLRIPEVTGYILAGVALGRRCWDGSARTAWPRWACSARSRCFILFSVGSVFEFSLFRRIGRQVVIVTLVEFASRRRGHARLAVARTALAGRAAARLHRHGHRARLDACGDPRMRQRGALTSNLLGIIAVNNLLCITFYGLVAAFIDMTVGLEGLSTADTLYRSLFWFVWQLVGSAALGYLVGLLLAGWASQVTEGGEMLILLAGSILLCVGARGRSASRRWWPAWPSARRW